MYVAIFIGIVIFGAIGCALVGLGHERGNGLMISAGVGMLFISMIALTMHP